MELIVRGSSPQIQFTVEIPDEPANSERMHKMADTVPSLGYPKFSLSESRFNQVGNIFYIPSKILIASITKLFGI